MVCKKVTLEYCVDNLTQKSSGKIAQLRNDFNQLRMKDEDEDEEFEIGESDFGDVIKRFESKSTKSYDFLLKAGEHYKRSMYNLCKRMVEKEEFPESFRKTLLYMIWKQKLLLKC